MAKPKRLRAPKGGITFQGKFYRGGQFLPAAAAKYLKATRTSATPPAKLDDDTLILIAMSELPTSTEAATSLHRYMSGRSTQRDRTILDGRRLQAIETLRERAATDREWMRWNDAYVRTASGIG